MDVEQTDRDEEDKILMTDDDEKMTTEKPSEDSKTSDAPGLVGRHGCVKRKVKVNKTWTCEDCGKIFKFLVHFYTHSKRVHDKDLSVNTKKVKKVKETGICKICGRDFSSISAVKKHVDAIHNKYGPFMCFTCDKEFPRLSMLKSHEPKCPLLVQDEVQESQNEPK